MQSTVEGVNDQIEVLGGVCYDIQPANRFRKMKAGSRARLFLAEALNYVPKGEFFFVQDHLRFRLEVEGPVERTLVHCKLVPHRNATRQRERWFRPVRILGMEEIPREPFASIGKSRAITENELALVAALLPEDFPHRRSVLQRGAYRVRELGPGIRYLWWRNPVAFGRRGEFTREYLNEQGEAMTVTLVVRDGIPDRLIARHASGGLGAFSAIREACLA